jgi:hypothetical protein
MQKHVLVLTTSAFILTCGAIAASAQQPPDVPEMQQQSQTLQQQLERQLQGTQIQRRVIEDDIEDDGWMGWGYGPGWRHREGWHRGDMGSGMMVQGGMDRRGMGSGMMMRMLFSLMDSDSDGTVALQEFQAAHERIFKAMDANKDGRLTFEEIQAFMQGARRSVQRQ